VAIAEAPQHDCDWERIRSVTGLDTLVDFYDHELGLELETIDLRREAVTYRNGVIAERRALPGDPAGYRLVDLGSRSAFTDSGLDPRRFRGADYDPGPTSHHHMDGRNEYLLSETALSADLLVNLPKLKTHKKTGVTLALKNLVGINGDKNLLPHHCRRLARAGRRRVSRRRGARPAAQRRDRGGARTARARDRRAARALGPARREPGARRRVHPRRQLVRQPDHLAHVPRPEPLPVLQRRARQPLRRAGARAHRAHRARRRGRGRGRRDRSRRATSRSAPCSRPPTRSRSISPRCA
jgi:hypothetical protein